MAQSPQSPQTPQAATRLSVPDPAVNAVIQDLYNKLAQVQAVLQGTLPPGSYPVTLGANPGKITINSIGLVTGVTPAS